jgi:hypothetical protein
MKNPGFYKKPGFFAGIPGFFLDIPARPADN